MYLTCSIGFGAVDQGAIERTVDGGQVACGHTGDACCEVSGQAWRGVGGVVVLRSIADGGQCGGDFLVVVQRGDGGEVVAGDVCNGGARIGHDGSLGVVGGDSAIGKDELVELVGVAVGDDDCLCLPVDGSG